MSLESKYNSITWIRKWLRGDLRRPDEVHLQQAANEDPFLAEALEGFQQAQSKDFEGDINRIRERLDQRISEKPNRRLFPILRIAAGIAALFIVGWLFYQINSSPEQLEAFVQVPSTEQEPPADLEAKKSSPQAEEEIAAEEAEVASPSTTSAPTTSRARTEDRTTSKQQKKEIAPPSLPAVTEETAPIGHQEAFAEDQDDQFAPKNEADNGPTIDELADVGITDLDLEAPTKIKPQFDSTFAGNRQSSMTRKIEGNVSDVFGAPLSTASIYITELDKEVVTDLNGHFEFELEEHESAQLLEVESVGYQRTVVEIDREESLDIILNPALNNAPLVTNSIIRESSAGTTMKRSKEATKPLPAQPEVGFRSYRKYIRKSMKTPTDPSLKGIVQLSFIIDPNGKPNNIIVEKSLHEAYDQEAIRLLKEGPIWLYPGYKGTYRFEFK